MQKMKTKGKSKARKTFFMFSAATTVLSIFVCFHIYVGDMSKGNILCFVFSYMKATVN